MPRLLKKIFQPSGWDKKKPQYCDEDSPGWDLIDEPERFEDDLRAAGNDFLKEFQQIANLKEQLASDIFQNCIGSKEFVQKI